MLRIHRHDFYRLLFFFDPQVYEPSLMRTPEHQRDASAIELEMAMRVEPETQRELQNCKVKGMDQSETVKVPV